MVDLHLSSGTNLRITELEAELHAARERIRELEARLETDPLLNILNRRGFERELKRALVYANRYRTEVAVLYIDIDNYKEMVDARNYLAGDAILRAISGTVVEAHRASDIVARFGTDDFMVVLWNVSEADARAKALALRRDIAALEVHFESEVLRTSASAGLTMLKRFDSPENVIARAELDMRTRKQPSVNDDRPMQAAVA